MVQDGQAIYAFGFLLGITCVCDLDSFALSLMFNFSRMKIKAEACGVF